MGKGIRLSEKHGVNPSIMMCPICFSETGVALLGKIENDAEAPKYAKDTEPCDLCREQMKIGFLLVEREGDVITGNRWVVTEEAAKRLFGEESVEQGAAYIDRDAAKRVGLYG